MNWRKVAFVGIPPCLKHGETEMTKRTGSLPLSTTLAGQRTTPEARSFDLRVETRKGEVQFSGFVDNQQQIDRALRLTRSIEGVVTVNDEMSIKK